jgi:hypothetical protein
MCGSWSMILTEDYKARIFETGRSGEHTDPIGITY